MRAVVGRAREAGVFSLVNSLDHSLWFGQNLPVKEKLLVGALLLIHGSSMAPHSALYPLKVLNVIHAVTLRNLCVCI